MRVFFEESRKLSLALPAARDLRQAVRGGDPRRLPRRRLRARARLPSPGRVRRRRHPRRPARDQGRALPRRRRHAARGAADADRRCAADAVQGRADPPADGEEHGPRARGRAARSDRREGEGLDPRRRLRRRALGPAEVQGPLRQGLLARRHDDLAAGERDLPPRDARQLPGREGDPAGGLRRPAAADGPRAARSSCATSPRSCAPTKRRR